MPVPFVLCSNMNRIKVTEISKPVIYFTLTLQLYFTRYCFVEKMYRDGILPGASASVLNEWFKWVTTTDCTDVDLIGNTLLSNNPPLSQLPACL